MKVKNHPVIPPPRMVQIEAYANQNKISVEDSATRLIEMRQAAIDLSENDPLRYGWEPPIWKIADALIDYEHLLDGSFDNELKKRGITWREWKDKIRCKLGFAQPVRMLLIMGGNRTGKSEYSAKRAMGRLSYANNQKIYAFHESNPRSIMDQQPLFWKYMPAEWKVQVMSDMAYIKYKRKTGFSEGSFIAPNGSACYFMNYMQDRDTALQGIEPDFVAPDELVPNDWVEEMMIRLVTRAGTGIVTFTPVHGWSPTVKLFMDSAEVTLWQRGYLLPRLGQGQSKHVTLGLSQDEYNEVLYSKDKVVYAPESRSLFNEWDLFDDKKNEHFIDNGEWEMVTRVARCVDPLKAVIYFHVGDNPYGNPKELLASMSNKGAGYVRERCYGIASKVVLGRFPRFNRAVHVLRPEQIEKENGTNYHIMDPAGGRNYYQCWLRVQQHGDGKKRYFVYREWPGNYLIPGIGVPGPWAIPSGRNNGKNDGARGEGQESWGFGHLRYKFEIARLERWRHYEEWKRQNIHKEYPADDDLMLWDERFGAQEVIEARIMDSRAASAPRIENDRPITLQTIFDELLVNFDLAPGSPIDDGVSAINSALDYEPEETEPCLFISSNCVNMIYALENWTGIDKEKGACKDPIDVLRYGLMSECEDVGTGVYGGIRGGVNYGVSDRGLEKIPFGPGKRLPVGIKNDYEDGYG